MGIEWRDAGDQGDGAGLGMVARGGWGGLAKLIDESLVIIKYHSQLTHPSIIVSNDNFALLRKNHNQ